jgi:dihydroanticapsin dehydrogenase
MDLNLSDHVVIVTGGGNGIGRATALALGEEKAKIVVADLNKEWVDDVSKQLENKGIEVLSLQVDISDEDSVKKMVTSAVNEFGRIDHLILCAGISGLYGKHLAEIEVSEWDRLFQVNVRGQWLCVKHFLPFLRVGLNSSITIVASDSAIVASPLHVPYCASKGSLIMLTKAMALDLRSDGIRVNCVCPSIVNTSMPKNDLGMSDGEEFENDFPIHQPEDIARYLILLTSPVTSTINGHALIADFGYSGQSIFPA